MTKLLQWLSVLSVLAAVWVSLVTEVLPFKLSNATNEVIWASPIYCLMIFACYSLGVIGYRVATFNDCVEASEELKHQIEEAKADLTSKGMSFAK